MAIRTNSTLWRIARRVAVQLRARGFRAVAVSGSLARGDAGPGSDIDLWAIGATSGRHERFIGGIPVTVFRSTPADLEDLEWINRWDIDSLVVLFDDHGDFARLKRRYARLRPALHLALERDAEARLERARGWRRAWLEFQLSVFRATGLRVAKWKHAEALLSERERATLRRKLKLPARVNRPRLLELTRKAPAEVRRLIRQPVPRWAAAEQHLRFGSVEEAVLKLRSELESWLPRERVGQSRVLSALAKAVVLGVLCVLAACVRAAPVPAPPPVKLGDPLELGLAGAAKLMCSATFISQRVPLEAWENSAQGFMPDSARDAGAEYSIDVPGRTVTVGLPGGPSRRATFHGDQGCVIGEAHFTPRALERKGSSSAQWPMGDEGVTTDPAFDAAVDAAFSDPAALTAAFVVVHRGRIVAERYGPGTTRDTALESWSMGKSLTATLLGLRVKDGTFPDVNARVPVPQWEGDERRAIRIVDLLHMSGGLLFRSSHDPDWKKEWGVPDHSFIYTGAVDVFDFSLSKPAQFPPNTEGRYRNCDPLILGWLLKRAAGDDYLAWPQRALFDRLGMRGMWLETDPYGNFLLTGYDYGTARDWARLGLLYAQDGVWQGERLLPEGWTKLVSTPAPAWKKPEYGGLFWLNRTREWPLPESAFMMVGAGGQRVFVVPELELVVVRMGHAKGGPVHAKSLKRALELVMSTLSPGGERDRVRGNPSPR